MPWEGEWVIWIGDVHSLYAYIYYKCVNYMNVLVLVYLIMEQHWMLQDCHLLFWQFYIGQVTLSEREDCTGNAHHQIFVTLCFFVSAILTRSIKMLTKTIPTF